MQTPILVKLKMKGIYKSILTIIGLLIAIALVIGILYLFYDKVLDTENEIEVNGVLSINYANGKKFEVESSKIIKFSVSNNSDKVNYYNIGFSKVRGNGTYRLLYNDNEIMKGTLKSIDELDTSEISIDAGETKMYVLEIINKGKEPLKGDLTIRMQNAKIVTFADTIIKNNTATLPLTEVGVDIATEDEGLIKTTDDIGVSYYFRGNVSNNYVLFANLTWRIVRINGDGTVRLILDGNADNVASYFDNDYKNYDYQESNINTYLKTWLEDNLKNQYNYLANGKFCNDMSYDDNNYLSYTRIYTNKIPMLNCLTNAFNSNIGILSIDELVLAGASPNKANTKFYLYNNEISDVWYTMSGAKKNGSNVNLFMFDNTGKIRTDVAGNLYRNVRPVINIVKNVEVSGNGTKNNPYQIKANN